MTESVEFTQMHIARYRVISEHSANSDILMAAMFLLLTIHLQSTTSNRTYQISSPLAPHNTSAQPPAMSQISS